MTDSIWRKPKQSPKAKAAPAHPAKVVEINSATDPEPADLSGLTVSQLRKLASKKGVDGFRGMKKAELLEALT